MKKLLVIAAMLLSFIVHAQIIRGNISYSKIVEGGNKKPDYDATVGVYKYDPILINFGASSSCILFQSAWNNREMYDYCKVMYGRHNTLTKEYKEKLLPKEQIDSLSDKCNGEISKLKYHIPTMLIKEAKVSAIGEYNMKLPQGKYYLVMQSAHTVLSRWTYIELKSESDELIENCDF